MFLAYFTLYSLINKDMDCFTFFLFWGSIFAKRIAGTKASRPESVTSLQDIAVQTQALLNVKDSNKVWFT